MDDAGLATGVFVRCGVRFVEYTVEVKLFSLLFLMVSFSGCLPSSRTILDSHRSCVTDEDCTVVLLNCTCMHCPREGDLQEKVIDAVNKTFTEQFSVLSKCTTEQMRRCATAGACAMMGTSIPKCVNKSCTAVFVPRAQ